MSASAIGLLIWIVIAVVATALDRNRSPTRLRLPEATAIKIGAARRRIPARRCAGGCTICDARDEIA